ncbi:extracellular solute-binding protein [Chelativorans sp. AA-79]|uniref:extracellular solute-binding protein n=1 Tax=Chelativorans sp. AA-79 TaxID=3028735 RepID=UPI0023F75604|nr:extracellular solute-binding protein [Chelativorans sp. AA-79]WEX11901.1 extracellular solute-binding protein [Chelativorans sp. AA-79]
MNGEPALPADFTHFPYANPEAPKGGEITYCVVGNFDNLNPFILKSMRTTARGVVDTIFGNFVFEPLMRRNGSEPFSLYGLLAESVEMDEDRTFAEFHLNPNAKWSDGEPVTPEDVIFTYETFAQKGRPPYSSRMARIEKIEKTGAHSVRFTFNEQSDREFPLVVALTPVIPAHAFDQETFDQTTLKPVIGSGPYVIDQVAPGQRIVFKRNPSYWGADIPSMRGFQNYDQITIEYFLNGNAQFEAFKKGLCSVYAGSDYTGLDPNSIARDFNFPAAESGDVIVESFDVKIPPAVSGFFFNTRREKFADPRVRRALSMLYDFGWVNKNVYNGQYHRTLSYWQGSELSALGSPATEEEKALLAPYQDKVQPEVMNGTYGAKADGTEEIDRDTMHEALNLLKEAGYEIDGRVLKDPQGNPFTFEILIVSAEQERLAAVFQRTLARLGIQVSLRMLDDAQIQQRKQTYDFDMLISSVGFSGTLSPGIEQIYRWGSEAAKAEGSFNLAGVADPAVDAMIDTMLNARDKEAYVAAVRALDRLLISGAYVIPTQHNTKVWIAYWNHLQHPEVSPLNGYDLSAWWLKPQ